MRKLLALAVSLLILSGCESEKKEDSEEKVEEVENPKPQVVSKLGITYFEPQRSEEVQKQLEANLEQARKRFNEEATEMNYIWYGRRTAYLSRYVAAIQIYTEGLEKYPTSYRLYRHRGHRYISIRDFDKAIDDLKKASDLMPKDTLETEPDGIPNRLNTPLSSTQFNVWYHLALAQYLKGDFKKSEKTYEKCMQTSVNADLVVATADWQYMTLRRQGKDSVAAAVLDLVYEGMQIVENDAYFKRLMMYKGQVAPDSLLTVSDENPDPDLALATQGYGVGNWYLYNGDTTKATEVFEKVVGGKHWSAFGFIAAEADLVRLEGE